ncbi:hypothetical protein ACFQLX_25110 [Streptomyces polyrhachis]|uniref:Integral membrane protein n=1 Tax=Streptomyces polyrhachis TaxID=1282885 RepID=A0ABW2GMI3_9ACTN
MSAPAPARPAPSSTAPQTLLRRVLLLDAAVTGANAVAYLAASGPLGDLLGVGDGLLPALGVFLLGYAAAVAALAARPAPPALGVRLVIDANVLWVAGSVLAPLLWLDPSTAGTVWTAMQAAVVLGFAALQWTLLRRVLGG